ncbi:MAG: GGDEF domain-containing protein [Clostridiales Family XIII bacterium]|nr:GGDEF domain-containing protein [Clostridiales Family XIII bacterium]
MAKRFYALINSKINWELFQNDNDVYLFLILNLAVAFALVMHVFLLSFFIVTGVDALITLNVVSVLLYTFSLHLVRRKRYAAAGVILVVEVIVYAFATIYLLGFDNYIVFYFFLLLIMQIIIPYASGYFRAFIVLLLGISVISAIIMDAGFPPQIDIGDAYAILSFFNIFSGFVGTLIELLAGNIINRIIASHNSMRMETFRKQAYTDPLTGLFNRRYAEQHFKSLAASPIESMGCVAMLDIDDFKKINDTYGHGAGDVLLEGLSGMMQQNLRKSDTIFRWGGEEFLICLSYVTLPIAGNILEKLRKNIEDSVFTIGENIIHFTVTIGVAELNRDSIEAGIDACDQNLYYGKQHGKNQVVTGCGQAAAT